VNTVNNTVENTVGLSSPAGRSKCSTPYDEVPNDSSPGLCRSLLFQAITSDIVSV
jgi:hypothetical protein